MDIIYQEILKSKSENKKLLAILLDPDKLTLDTIPFLVEKINQSPATHLFVGGSSFEGTNLNEIILKIKLETTLPIYFFLVILHRFLTTQMEFYF